MDLFDTALKSEIRDAMKNVFDTFSRVTKIRFYKIQEEEVVLFDTNYNADFEEMNRHNDSVVSVAEFQEFDARIIYQDRQEGSSFLSGSEELNVKTRQLYGRIKIQLEQDGYDYIKNSKVFTFLGDHYQTESDIRGIGLAKEFQFYNLILIKTP